MLERYRLSARIAAIVEAELARHKDVFQDRFTLMTQGLDRLRLDLAKMEKKIMDAATDVKTAADKMAAAVADTMAKLSAMSGSMNSAADKMNVAADAIMQFIANNNSVNLHGVAKSLTDGAAALTAKVVEASQVMGSLDTAAGHLAEDTAQINASGAPATPPV